MNRHPRALALALALSAACANAAPTADGDTVLPDLPQESNQTAIPYPAIDQQTQIDQMSIQIARLEREIGLLTNRIQRLEHSAKAKPPAKRSMGVQRLDDAALKKHYQADTAAENGQDDPVAANERRLYEQALQRYRQGNYQAAAALLKGADGGNGSETARRNMYLLLQSQQRLGNCESVIEIGGRYANRFHSSHQTPDAVYSIGQCQYAMQQKDIARNTWRKLIQRYPDSNAAKQAAARLQQR
ncbi:tetratricopeptide repeat protein [Neisseria lisongii]|uniref:Tetratricopeptide repeat protein n=1 Tax=Neisseria lisongii TaxID=2912188 RepID=A0AAW5ARQ1_9NEIS|nr:tetratricopeptide repeat protein [Neisseria lisongii]MCF7529675.1 tetratricopeptide repeat protein [Neisseria lisongii]